MRRSLILVAVLTVLAGCHSQAYKAASAMNAYDYREARYEESCIPFSVKPYCKTAKERLDRARKHILEAVTAVKNGGSAKLQLELVRKDLKGLDDVD